MTPTTAPPDATAELSRTSIDGVSTAIVEVGEPDDTHLRTGVAVFHTRPDTLGVLVTQVHHRDDGTTHTRQAIAEELPRTLVAQALLDGRFGQALDQLDELAQPCNPRSRAFCARGDCLHCDLADQLGPVLDDLRRSTTG